MDFKMFVTLTTLLGILHFAAGGLHAVCPTQPITVFEGENVALHCGLDRPVNLSLYSVHCTRVDNGQRVYVYRHGRDDAGPVVVQYRGRTTGNHEDLINRNMTLKISSVNLSDSGSYKCFVPKWNASCVVHLIVEEKGTKTDDSSTTGPPPEEGPESDAHDAVKVVLPVVGVLLLVAAAAAAAVLLWRCGVIEICKKTFRGKKKTTSNDFEMENMVTGPTAGDEDPHSAAEALMVVHDENHSSRKTIQQERCMRMLKGERQQEYERQ